MREPCYVVTMGQRYIASLNMAGEWIEYDCSKRGWRLVSGSLLLGDEVG